MKKIILTVASAIALMNATHAANPFTGFYLGGGMALNGAKIEDGSDRNANNKDKFSKSKTTTSFLTYMGYGQTFGGGFYFGGELTLGYETGAKFASTDTTTDANNKETMSLRSKGGFSGEIATRLGYVICNKTLVYGKIGYAWQPKAEFSGEGLDAGQKFQYKKLSYSRNGWILGFGAEHALSTNWLIRGEYKYNFGTRANKEVISVSNGVETREGNLKLRTKTHTFTLGVAYKF